MACFGAYLMHLSGEAGKDVGQTDTFHILYILLIKALVVQTFDLLPRGLYCIPCELSQAITEQWDSTAPTAVGRALHKARLEQMTARSVLCL